MPIDDDLDRIAASLRGKPEYFEPEPDNRIFAPDQRCDFCNGPLDPDTAVAEEAGQWACAACWKKFEAEDHELKAARLRERNIG